MNISKSHKHKNFYIVYALYLCFTLLIVMGCAHVKEKAELSLQVPKTCVCTGFINKTLDNGNLMKRYVVYVPYEYTPETEIPMIVFLHGAGERNNNGLSQTEIGIGSSIRRHPERWEAIVVFPQCPSDRFYNEMIDDIDKCIDETLKEYNIDKKRIYLTGLSMGGFGTWIYGAKRSDFFAALVPICGGGELNFIKQKLGLLQIPDESPKDVEERVQQLKDMPIWAFHGTDDNVVPPEYSRNFVQKIKDTGNTKIRYTEYPGVKHDSWVKAYDEIDLSKWLFSQHK
ncbi:MAG TPA: prolyl oligopeptidase family serine peptidase [Candidatus Hydrogenedens sp.]|nr:prolyl oligopeptidase family serine peptidase [Candidatus Hydrogenedens sp.]